jgi:hypothetical protein
MAVLSAACVGVSGEVNGDDPLFIKKSFVARYVVTVSDENVGPFQIEDYFQQTPTLPWPGRPLSLLNSFNTSAVCKKLNVGEREKGSLTIWPVTATFEPPSDDDEKDDRPDGKKTKDPLLWHDEIDISYQPITVAVQEARFIKATNGAVGTRLKPDSIGKIRDSAGMAFVPPPETEEYIKIVRITRKQKKIFGSTDRVDDVTTKLENTVNKSEVVIDKSAYGIVVVVPPYRGLLMPFQGSFQVTNGIPHWSTTVEVHIHPKTWRGRYLDEGYFGAAYLGGSDGRGGVFSNTNPTPSMLITGAADVYAFTEKGRAVSRMLDGKGSPKKDDEPPVFLEYAIKDEADWSDIVW